MIQASLTGAQRVTFDYSSGRISEASFEFRQLHLQSEDALSVAAQTDLSSSWSCAICSMSWQVRSSKWITDSILVFVPRRALQGEERRRLQYRASQLWGANLTLIRYLQAQLWWCPIAAHQCDFANLCRVYDDLRERAMLSNGLALGQPTPAGHKMTFAGQTSHLLLKNDLQDRAPIPLSSTDRLRWTRVPIKVWVQMPKARETKAYSLSGKQIL